MKAVIFAGGVGTRLWPMSRSNFPKQFQLLVGSRSIFRQTIERVLKGFEPENVFVSTGREYARYVVEQAPEIPQKNIILEPQRRDSLGAVGYATMYIHRYFPESVMVAIWGADHLVENEKAFHKALRLAAKVANEEPVICKVDARPTFPSTFNGWVEIGKVVKKIDGMDIYEFVRFVEKPDLPTAKRMFRSFKYLINVGYMAWKTKTMLSFYQKYQANVYQHLEKIGKAMGTDQEQEVLEAEYPKIEKNSVDYGIFEKLKPKDMLVIPADMGWTDIGTWDLLFSGLAKNDKDNITQGDIYPIDSQGNLIWSSNKKIIGIIGLENLVIVDTKDALLVCRRDRSGEVKQLTEILKEKGKKDYL